MLLIIMRNIDYIDFESITQMREKTIDRGIVSWYKTQIKEVINEICTVGCLFCYTHFHQYYMLSWGTKFKQWGGPLEKYFNHTILRLQYRKRKKRPFLLASTSFIKSRTLASSLKQTANSPPITCFNEESRIFSLTCFISQFEDWRRLL